MSREIKFRGKRTDNGQWVYGWLVDTCYGISIITDKLYHVDGSEWNVTSYEIIPESLGQFTGLKDKNGKEIYEGDLVKIEIEDEDSVSGNVLEYSGVVIYGSDYKTTNKRYVTDYPCSFIVHCKDWYHEEGLLGNTRHLYEVIGNIHENKDLL